MVYSEKEAWVGQIIPERLRDAFHKKNLVVNHV